MEGPSPRIVKETKTIQTDPVPGITFKPDSNNYKHFFIELNGMYSLIQVLQAPAMMEENSKLNSSFQMTTPCHLQKSCLTPKSTIPTSVLPHLSRQLRTYLSRHSQKELVSRFADEVCSSFDPKFVG